MPIITITKRDMLRSKILTPGWYRVKVENIGEKTSNDQKSINYPVESTVICNADDGSEEFAGVPLGGPGSWMFNSKAMGFALGFVKSLGEEVDETKEEQKFNLSGAEGKLIEVFVENGEYEGRIQNKVKHQYRPVRS